MEGFGDTQTVSTSGRKGQHPLSLPPVSTSPWSPASHSHFFLAKQTDSITQIDQLIKLGRLAASLLPFGSGFAALDTMDISTFSPALLGSGACMLLTLVSDSPDPATYLSGIET